MTEDENPDQDPEDEEKEWNERVSPRLRTLIREELDEHHQRTQAPKDDTPDPPKDETKKDDDDRSKPPKRNLARRWFGID